MLAFRQPFLRALASVLGNLSAAWFVVAFITPNFADITSFEGALVLTRDILFGIVFLLAATIIERLL